jgi:drug/metabolite transporter (DMT)-like permease
VSTLIFLLVLFGALFHAIWNTFIKLSPDKSLETAFMNLSGSLIVLPALIYFGFPEKEVWPFLSATLLLHIIYYYSLSGAYRWGDMSLTYPIMRGVAPLMLVVLTSCTSMDNLPLLATYGVACIGIGVIFLGVTPKHQDNLLKAIAFSILNAVVIASDTIVDGFAVRAVIEPFSYIATFMFIDGFMYSGLVIYRRSWPLIKYKKYIQDRWQYFSVGAMATILSYGIALWAMTRAPISMVSALREVAVLFGLVIAHLFLKEKINLYRLLGISLIFFGATLIKVNY